MSEAPQRAFRPLAAADLPMLRGWLLRPHVAQWWGAAASLEELQRDYISAGATRAWIALLAGEPLGFIQSYVAVDSGGGWWANETDPGVRGIDQFLADAHRLGQGLGSAMVRAFVETLFADASVTRVQADPDPGNARAIACYLKSGFRADRRIVTPDGPALLMLRERPPA